MCGKTSSDVEFIEHQLRGKVAAGRFALDPFEPFGENERCLLPEGEIERGFPGWRIAYARREVFVAPGATQKRFDTVVAERA